MALRIAVKGADYRLTAFSVSCKMQPMSEPRTTKYALVDRLLGGTLTDKLTAWRNAGTSYDEIAYRLRADHDVNVSTATVYRWCADLPTSSPVTDGAA